MTELIACLSTGKGTWGHVSHLIEKGNWDKIFLITNEYGKENFNINDKIELIVIDERIGLRELRDNIHEELKKKVKGVEIALNISSGTGKEHTALIAALLKMGIGIKLVAITKDGVEEL